MAHRLACPRVHRRPRVGRAALGGEPAALDPYTNPYLDDSHARANDSRANGDHHGADVSHSGADHPDAVSDDPDPGADHADPDPDAALQSARHPDPDTHPYGHPDA
jgi:hypothetical protein